MAVSLVRVDNRLVHGQVLEAWAPQLGVDAILVVDRNRAGDAFHQAIFRALSRPGLEVRVETPQAAAALLGTTWKGHRVLVLFEGLAQALEGHAAGVAFAHLNLGNIHPHPGSRPVTPSVYLAAEDWRDLEALRRAGVEVEARAVPGDRSPLLVAPVGWEG